MALATRSSYRLIHKLLNNRVVYSYCTSMDSAYKSPMEEDHVDPKPAIPEDPSKHATFSFNQNPEKIAPTPRHKGKKVTKTLVKYDGLDHNKVTKILKQTDWHIELGEMLKQHPKMLTPTSVTRVLQYLENAELALKFFLWVEQQKAYNKRTFVIVQKQLSHTLVRHGPCVLSVDLLKHIGTANLKLTEDALCALIASWGKLGLARYGCEVFGQMCYMNIAPKTRLYNFIIEALVRSNYIDLAYLKFQEMSVAGCPPDTLTYNLLINGVCKSGIMDEAYRLLNQMQMEGKIPNVFTYTIFIDGFCKAGKFLKAFQVLDSMKKRKRVPTEATYRSLVHGIFKHNEGTVAFRMIEQWLSIQTKWPEAVCDAVLESLSERNLSVQTCMFLTSALGKGYFPKTPLLSVALSCLCKGEQFDLALKLLSGKNKRIGDVSCYCILVSGLCSAGRIEEAKQHATTMISDFKVNDIFTCNLLIDCFSKAGSMDIATGIFHDFVAKGTSPNLVTFNTLISGYSKLGNVSEARKHMELILKHGLKPDVYTFSSMIDCLCRSQKVDEGMKCLSEMRKWNITPNAVTYNTLIRSLCKEERIEKAFGIFRRMEKSGIQPDLFSFNSLMVALCKMGKHDEAFRMVKDLLNMGMKPDHYTYNSFMKVLCDGHRMDEAKSLMQIMEENGCAPNTVTYSLVRNGIVIPNHSQDVFSF